MKRISKTAFIAIVIWLLLLYTGFQGIERVVAQHVQGYPSAGQIRIYVLFPAIVAVAVTFGVVQVFSLLMMFPFLLLYTGGV